MLKKIMLFVAFFVLFMMQYCDQSTEPYNLNNFDGITETDEQGNLIGNIDLNDWSRNAYNVHFGQSIWIYNFTNQITMICDTITNETSRELKIKNISNTNITITSNVDSPFYCQPSSFDILPDSMRSFSLVFSLSGIVQETFYDTLNLTCSGSESVQIFLEGYQDNSGISIIGNPNQEILFYPAYPNPAQNSTTLSFTLVQSSHVSVKILDVTGNVVKELFNNYTNAGLHSIQWDLTNSSGNKIASTLYRAVLEVGDFKVYGDILVL